MAKSQQLSWIGTFPREDAAIVVNEIERQKATRRDFLYPAKKLSMLPTGEIVLGETEGFKVGDTTYTEWSEAESAAKATGVKLEYAGKIAPMTLGATAFRQLCAKLGIERMNQFTRDLIEKGHGDLAAENFRTLLSRDDRRFLVRTLDGRARAILSDSYRVLDNSDLFFCAAEEFQNVGADIWNARMSEDRFQMLAVSPHIRGAVSIDRTFDPGDGWQSRWHGTEGDVHNAAVSITNSETGNGGLGVNLAIMRKVCANFNVWTNGVAQIHAGKTNDGEGEISFSDETRASEARTIWLKVRDAIRTAFDPIKFKALIDRLNVATTDVIPAANVEKAIDNVVAEYAIPESRKLAILSNLLKSGDRTRYGVIQAVTAAAHDADSDTDPDSAFDLESVGAKLTDVSSTRFAVLAGVK